jgi:transcriptional regulator with XRE-family HTH domain
VYLPDVSDAAPQDGRPDAAAPADRSIGRYLASQRELRGISLDELAARTKIPRRNLERLESGVFDTQSDGFVRGFVRTVAESLGLDPHEAVMRLVGEPPGDDEELRRRRMWSAAGLVVVALTSLLLLGMGVRLAMLWIVESSGGEPELVRRPDAVRSLVEQRDAAKPGADRSRGRDAGAADGER